MFSCIKLCLLFSSYLVYESTLFAEAAHKNHSCGCSCGNFSHRGLVLVVLVSTLEHRIIQDPTMYVGAQINALVNGRPPFREGRLEAQGAKTERPFSNRSRHTWNNALVKWWMSHSFLRARLSAILRTKLQQEVDVSDEFRSFFQALRLMRFRQEDRNRGDSTPRNECNASELALGRSAKSPAVWPSKAKTFWMTQNRAAMNFLSFYESCVWDFKAV